MIIHSYEKSVRAEALADELTRLDEANAFLDVTVLPIPSVKGGFINGTDVRIEEIAKTGRAGSLVIGYAIPSEIVTELIDRGAVVCDAALDEDFLLDNGELTALCALGIILTSEKRAPLDLSFGIVGYGRIGKALSRKLLFLGASVKIYTTRKDVRLELCEYGVATEMSCESADLGSLDVLINTAPAVIFDTAREDFPEHLRIIDLASGDNFPNLRTVEKYPSVPAKMFPVSAGKIWARSVERQLTNRGIYG